MPATPRSSPYASVHEPQLTIDGREVQPASEPTACEVLALFSAAPSIRGQLACPDAPECATRPQVAPQPTKRSTSPADPAHRARMDAGRERAQHERELRSVARVEAWRQWSRSGGRGPMPELPRDADFRTAREHGSRWAS